MSGQRAGRYSGKATQLPPCPVLCVAVQDEDFFKGVLMVLKCVVTYLSVLITAGPTADTVVRYVTCSVSTRIRVIEVELASFRLRIGVV